MGLLDKMFDNDKNDDKNRKPADFSDVKSSTPKADFSDVRGGSSTAPADSRSGRWYLLEINARCNLWHYLGARNGVNLMAAAYDFMVDRKPPARVRYATRDRWLSLDLDFKAYRELSQRGELTFAAWAAEQAGARLLGSLEDAHPLQGLVPLLRVADPLL